MKKVLLFARDPGGANTLIPLYSRLKNKYRVVIYGKDVAVKWFQNEGIACNDICDVCREIDLKSIELFLRELVPDFIITGTSLDDYTERYLWKSAELLGIKSFAILDQWMNMGIRFSKYNYKQCDLYEKEREHIYMPYRIFVMDEMAKDIICKDGIPREKVCVTGQPHFEEINRKYEESKSFLDNKKWNVLFVSEPIIQDYEDNLDKCDYWGFNEKRIYQTLYDVLNILAKNFNQDICFIIKPHPRENIELWKRIVSNSNYEKVEVLLSTKEEKYSLLKSVDLVCGMSSMMLLEATICKKDILSVMIGLKRENPFILDKLNICKSCLKEEDLLQLIKECYKADRKKVSFEYIENASEKVIACIEKEI